MNILVLILTVLALVLFGIAAAGIGAGRINLAAAGLLCLTLAHLLGGVGADLD